MLFWIDGLSSKVVVDPSGDTKIEGKDGEEGGDPLLLGQDETAGAWNAIVLPPSLAFALFPSLSSLPLPCPQALYPIYFRPPFSRFCDVAAAGEGGRLSVDRPAIIVSARVG